MLSSALHVPKHLCKPEGSVGLLPACLTPLVCSPRSGTNLSQSPLAFVVLRKVLWGYHTPSPKFRGVIVTFSLEGLIIVHQGCQGLGIACPCFKVKKGLEELLLAAVTSAGKPTASLVQLPQRNPQLDLNRRFLPKWFPSIFFFFLNFEFHFPLNSLSFRSPSE